MGSFDRYIATLENYCSVIFAISFLLIFYVLAITFSIIDIALIANYVLDNDSLPNWLKGVVGIIFMVFIIFGMLLTLIDFITLGFLKKKKWISRIYFPVYWVFSFITLSFLYRPLVYNFLDNRFGRRLSLILIPFYILILAVTSVNYKNSNYFDGDISSDVYIANNRNYEDMVAHLDKEFIDDVAIQSKVITDPFIKVFVVFSERVENRVYSFNPDLEPKKDRRGLQSNIVFNSDFDSPINDSTRTAYVETLNKIYSVKIDTLEINSEFVMGRSKKDELGFETYLSTKDLSEGKHILKVNRLRIREEDTTKWNVATIPFWYFKD